MTALRGSIRRNGAVVFWLVVWVGVGRVGVGGEFLVVLRLLSYRLGAWKWAGRGLVAWCLVAAGRAVWLLCGCQAEPGSTDL